MTNKYDDWREDVETFYHGEHAQAVLDLWDEFQPEISLLMCDKLMALLDKVLFAHENELIYLEAKLLSESEVEL